jgi:DNA-binding NtrC family response regulator
MEGYSVETACDGEEAIDIFKRQAFDLVFLDIKLPKIRGTEVLKRLKEINLKTPVIIMTAYATVKNAVDCTNLGAVSYIQKPFTPDRIKSILRELNLSTESCNGDSYTHIERAELFIEEKLFSESIEVLKKAIALEPTNERLYLLFSEAYKGLGDMSNADKFYKTFEIFKNY